METKEMIQEKIAELDKSVEILKKRLHETVDEAAREAVIEEMYVLMARTNRYLRAIGADEKEMYDL